MPGELRHHARRQGEFLVGAADQVLHEDIPALGVLDEVAKERVEMLRRHRLVVVPPDMGPGIGVTDNELVLRRPAGVLAGLGHQRTVSGKLGLAAADRFLVEFRLVEVVVNGGKVHQACSGDRLRAFADLFHPCSLSLGPSSSIAMARRRNRPHFSPEKSGEMSEAEKPIEIKYLIDLNFLTSVKSVIFRDIGFRRAAERSCGQSVAGGSCVRSKSRAWRGDKTMGIKLDHRVHLDVRVR